MTLSMVSLITLAGVDLLLLFAMILNPSLVRGRGGTLLAVASLILFPVGLVAMGSGQHLDRATRTSFCLSCHVMSDYGQSLYVDDDQFLAANHFQNRLVPRDKACYACHTDYTMFGDLGAKLRGARHLYVQYLGEIPETLELYGRYHNRECLHCHEGARSFSESPYHVDQLEQLQTNEVSCLSSGCHETIHELGAINDLDTWLPRGPQR